MHSAAVAEWILSLVAPPDRAASTVGDLVEEASSRGTLWFWSCVLRTAGSHLWHDLTVSPLRMLDLAFRWFLTCWFLGSLLGFFVISVWIGILDRLGIMVCDAGGCSVSVPPWGYSILAVVVCTAIPFLVGLEGGPLVRWPRNGRRLRGGLPVRRVLCVELQPRPSYRNDKLENPGPVWSTHSLRIAPEPSP